MNCKVIQAALIGALAVGLPSAAGATTTSLGTLAPTATGQTYAYPNGVLGGSGNNVIDYYTFTTPATESAVLTLSLLEKSSKDPTGVLSGYLYQGTPTSGALELTVLAGTSGSYTLSKGTNYYVEIAGNPEFLGSHPVQYKYSLNLKDATAPVPGPAGLLVAAVGALLIFVMGARKKQQQLAFA